jgi:hypothetical protein
MTHLEEGLLQGAMFGIRFMLQNEVPFVSNSVWIGWEAGLTPATKSPDEYPKEILRNLYFKQTQQLT